MFTYSLTSKTYPLINMEVFLKSLSPTEIALIKYCKMTVTGGKGSRPVIILLPKNLQAYVVFVIKIWNEIGIVHAKN